MNKYSFNVYSYDEDRLYVVHKTKLHKGYNMHINLLLICKKDKFHFAYIKNMSRLCRSQMTSDCRKQIHCASCNTFFKNSHRFENHINLCNKFNDMPVEFPKDDYMMSTNMEKQIEHPFSIVADTEALLRPCDGKEMSGAFQEHVGHSVRFHFHTAHENLIKSEYSAKRGKDRLDWFAKQIIEYALKVHKIFKSTNMAMEMTDKEKQDHNNADK